MTPPESEPQRSNDKQPSSGARGRGRDRGRGRGRGPSRDPKKFFCHFHGSDSDHRTNQCPEKKKTLDRMEAEKKAKLVGHTTWPQTQQPQQIQYTQPSFVPTQPFTQAYRPPMFNYNYNHSWQPQPNPPTQTIQPTAQAQPTQEQLPPPQLTHQNKKTKPQIANPRHYHPSA